MEHGLLHGAHRKVRTRECALLEGSWVLLSRVISTLNKVITVATLLLTLLIGTHEPSSRASGSGFWA